MNILITGCNGQLGSELRAIEKEYAQYRFFNTSHQELDVTDHVAVAAYVEEHEIDGIINCSAYTAVDKAESDIDNCKAINTEAPANLAMAIEKRGGWLIHVSTDYVFDGTKHTPYNETDATCPNSVYGSTKLAGEESAMKLCQHTMVVRTSWLYSAFGNNFVKTMIRVGRTKDEVGGIFDEMGSPT